MPQSLLAVVQRFALQIVSHHTNSPGMVGSNIRLSPIWGIDTHEMMVVSPRTLGAAISAVSAFVLIWRGVRLRLKALSVAPDQEEAFLRHPCGSIPVTSLSVGLFYCHHHQAWFGHIYEVVENGGEPGYEAYRDVEFGPFDTTEDVYTWAIRRLEELLMRSGRPWGSWRDA